MPLNHYSGFAFHFYHIKSSAKVRDPRQKKITRAGDLQGDFSNE
jgi:hypothetical protein